MPEYMKTFLKIIKIIFLTLAAFLLLSMLFVFLFFQIPAVQNYVADQALKIARDKLDTEIGLEKIVIIPPNSVKLKEIYLEGTDGDTLLYSEELALNIGLFKLINKEIELNRLKISSTRANIIRSGPDSTFNFPGINNSADKKEAGKVKSSSKWTFDINRIILDKVDFLFEDKNMENSYFASVGDLRLKMSSLDPEIPEIGVHSIKLNDSDVELFIRSGQEKEKDEDSNVPKITLDRDIEIENVNFLMVNETVGQKLAINNLNLYIESDQLNLPSKELFLKKVNLEETDLIMVPLGDIASVDTTSKKEENKPFDWNIRINELKFINNDLEIRTETHPLPSAGFNPKNIDIKELSGGLYSIALNKDSVGIEIRDLQLIEGGQFRLENLSSKISANSHQANIERLYLKTPDTRILLDLNAKNYDPDDLQNSWKDAFLNLNLEKSYVGTDDILFFYPEFSAGEYRRAINNLVFETEIYGKLSDLTLDNFRAHMNEDVILKIQGDIKGLPELENISGDFNVDSIYLSGNTSRYYFPDSLIPPQIFIPENFLLEAVATGNTRLSRSSLEISSAAGGLQADLQLNMDKENEREYFQAVVSSKGLDVGTIMQKPDTLGKVFMNASLKGSTKDFKQARAEVRLMIDTFHLIGYPYSNFSLIGNIEQKRFEGTAGMDDENIRFSFNGMIDAADSIPYMDLTFNLIGANLMALNISEEDIRVGANMASSISGSNPDNLNGDLKLNNLIIVRNDQVYELDSLFLKANNSEKSTELSVSSEIIQASYKGSVKPSRISSTIWSHMNLFFAFQKDLPDSTKTPGDFAFEVHVNDHPIISEVFLPELTSFHGIDIQVDYEEGNNELNTKAVISPIQYKNTDIDTVNININSIDTLLFVQVDSKGFSQDFINIPGIITEARLANDTAKWTFKVKDEEEKDKYRINGTFKKEGQFISGNFDSSKLVLNYDSWNLPPNHKFRISNDTVIFDNLSLGREEQVLSLTKTANGPGIKGTKIEFAAFDLETLTNLLTTKNLVEARLNGEIIFNLKNSTRFNSELQIADLAIYGEEIFNMIAIKAEQTENDRITFRGQLEDQEERIRLMGWYSLQPENKIELDVNIKDLDMQSFQPLLSDIFRTLSGTFNGDINLSGPVEQLKVNGDIQFVDGKIVPRMLGTTFKSENIRLKFDDNDLQFTDFIFLDADGNEASVSGSIEGLLSDSPFLNLKVDANNFTGMNVNEGVNDLFFGKLSMDMSASIKGNFSAPVIRGTTTITNNTDFNFIVPSPDKATIEREGLVIFIEPEKDTTSILFSGLEDEKTQISTGSNLDINTTLEVQEEASINIIIDPASDENLKVLGEANLNFSMGQGGQVSLTGQYIINEGTYNLTLYNIIRRQFKIQEGSSITWTGDPLGAKTDITAYYRVRTSPEGLIANELSNINDEQRREISQSIPFLVYLNIKGDLLSPSTLDFDIKTPPGVTIAEVTTKLNQLNQNESEVNKQAVALLTFGNFIQTQMSTAHPVSYEINAAARNSISRILSTQLNKLADQYIEGIEINVDVSSYADYTGQQTQATTNVALDVQKEFLNERLTVQVGGKVNIEGDERMANNMNRLAGDVKVLYDLTKDGRFKLKGFNTTEYENIFEGEVTKTGVGVIYNRDVYSLSELFNLKKKENDNENNNE